MVKRINRVVIISLLMLFAAQSYSAQATQMWKCGLEDDAYEEDVEELVAAWVKAARQMEGGAQIEVHVFMPVVASPEGETDFIIAAVSPSFADWGKFWDGYPDSPAADAEEQAHEKFICPDSELWQAIRVE